VQTRYGPKHRAKPGRKHLTRSPKRSSGRRTTSIRTAPREQPELRSEALAHSRVEQTAPRTPAPALTRPERPVRASMPGPAAPPADDPYVSDGHKRLEQLRPPPQPLRAPESNAPRQSFGQFLSELPVLIVVALVIAILVKSFVMQAFFIPSGSMENTLQVGDRVLVAKFLYRFMEPKHPDVVVFVSPISRATPEPERNIFGKVTNEIAEGLGLRSSEQDFIKRVIATEGQTVEIKVGSVYVNNEKIDEPYRHDLEPLPDYPATLVPPGKVFVMGDNRSNSEDSRVFGPIPESSIIGRAFVLIWPLNRVQWLGR
jgi:signal peptidase I